MSKETPEMLASVLAKLRYCPETGALWRGDRQAFTAINRNTPRGYHVGKMGNVQMYAHRVVWALQTGDWPAGQIDHINGDSLDNRWQNLRVVTPEGNQKNRRLNRNNKSGVSGVMYLPEKQVWQAQIKHQGRMVFLGWHKCFFRAVGARKSAEIEYGFHKNHGTVVRYDA